MAEHAHLDALPSPESRLEGANSSPEIEPGETSLTPEYVAAYADIPATAPSGGDFHQASVQSDSGNVNVVIGDVSGHGPEQTLQAEHMRELLSNCLAVGLSPSETLGAVNAMIESDPHFEGFGTVFVGTIEAETGKLTYASGGHEPALIATPSEATAVVKELVGTGPPVGAFPTELARYEQRETILPAGGTLLLYTDGVPDARPPHTRREWLGIERLKTILARLATFSPRRLVATLLKRVVTFCRGHFDDDVAVMAVRRRARRSRRD